MIQEIKEITVDKLQVKIFNTRRQMGAEAALNVSQRIAELLSRKEFVNIIFAAAPSQNEFLAFLSLQDSVEWNRVNAFHMDEYLGLEKDATQRFAYFLKEALFDKVDFHEVHYLNEDNGDPYEECERYTNLLNKHRIDIVCMGIGENAHMAFNDPHVADFNDPLKVKVVDLDEVSRQQQVNDDCFAQITDVPTSAITLTVPALLEADYIYCIVPGTNKSMAVYHTLHSGITEAYPSTVLRKHKNATLYLDKNSAVRLK